MLPLLLTVLNALCSAKSFKHEETMDLMYSDSSHGETAAQQQVLYIDHGGGAISQIRRTSYIQPQAPSVPQAPFSPHVNFYPNALFDGGGGGGGGGYDEGNFFNFPGGDIPRIFERRSGDNTPRTDVSPPTPAPPLNQHPPPPNPKVEIEDKVTLPVPIAPASVPPPPPPVNDPQLSPFFNFVQPELFPFFNGPFAPLASPLAPPMPPLFQRRKLTVNNHVQDLNHNTIGYPSYTYYKGGGEDNPSLTNWPKIFKFTDGRANLSEFEKQKKHGKIKFSSKDAFFDNISRDSFLILHGGTYTY